jgi:hypothetical protein
MKRIRPLFAASVILALATLLPVAALAAQALSPTTEPSPTTDLEVSPETTPVPDTCWDCVDSSMTSEEGRAIYCSAQSLKENPQMLDECFPDKWEWVCFPEGNCEMYRRDLDPLGIFATPPPPPTPGVPPTPVPTATPDPTPVPDPESPATATPLPTELP